jgi:hypothetical protein
MGSIPIQLALDVSASGKRREWRDEMVQRKTTGRAIAFANELAMRHRETLKGSLFHPKTH